MRSDVGTRAESLLPGWTGSGVGSEGVGSEGLGTRKEGGGCASRGGAGSRCREHAHTRPRWLRCRAWQASDLEHRLQGDYRVGHALAELDVLGVDDWVDGVHHRIETDGQQQEGREEGRDVVGLCSAAARQAHTTRAHDTRTRHAHTTRAHGTRTRHAHTTRAHDTRAHTPDKMCSVSNWRARRGRSTTAQVMDGRAWQVHGAAVTGGVGGGAAGGSAGVTVVAIGGGVRTRAGGAP